MSKNSTFNFTALVNTRKRILEFTSPIWNGQRIDNVIEISFVGDQVLAEFLDGLVQEHQRQDDLVSTVILKEIVF